MNHLDKTQFGPWALITGASSGIGKEFARQVAASGINVVLVARRLPVLTDWGEQLQRDYGIKFRALEVDLANVDFIEQLTAQTADLDIGLLVSNAGTGIPGRFLDTPEDALLELVNLNSISHLRLVHYFGRHLVTRGRGGIVLVSAMGALDGIPNMANGAATKAYVTSLGQGLHVELANSGVHTTVLIPGPTETPIIDKFGLNTVKMPMKLMSVEQCVDEGIAALKANRATHLTGRVNRIMARLLPASLTRSINGKMLAKGLDSGQPRLAHL